MTTPIGGGPPPLTPSGGGPIPFSPTPLTGPIIELTDEEIAFFQQLQADVRAPLVEEGRFTINDLYFNIEAFLRGFIDEAKLADLADILKNIDLARMNSEVAILVRNFVDFVTGLFSNHTEAVADLQTARAGILNKSAEITAAQTLYNNALNAFKATQPATINQAIQDYASATIDFNQLNAAIDNYNAEAASVQAEADALNALIDEYNGFVQDYNDAIAGLVIVNEQRAENNIKPPLNIPAPIAEISAGDKIPTIPTVANVNMGDPAPPLVDLSGILNSTFTPVATIPPVPQLNFGNYAAPTSDILLESLSAQIDELITSSEEASDIDTLLSIVLLRRGKVTANEKLQISDTAQAVAASNEASSLSAIVLGLGTPRLITALSTVLFSESIKSIFDQSALPNIDRLLSNLKTAISQVINNAATLNILASTQIAKDLLSQVGINSFPVTVALNLGLINALNTALVGASLKNSVGSVIDANGGSSKLTEFDRENLIDSLNTVGTLFLVGVSSAQIGRVLGESGLVLGTTSLNLAFGLSRIQLDLREEAKQIQALLTPEQFQVLQKDLKEGLKAFLPEDLVPGIVKDIFEAEDPLKTILNILGKIPDSEQVAKRIASSLQIAAFAVIADAGDPLQGIDLVAAKKALKDRVDFAEIFFEAGQLDTSFIGRIEFIRSQLGEDANVVLGQAIPGLFNAQVEASLLERLTGEVGKGQAQVLTKEFLNSINSTLNIQAKEIEKIVEREDQELAKTSLDSFRKFIVEDTTEQTKILENEINPAYTFVGLMYEGMGGTVKGKKDIDVLGGNIPPSSTTTPA